MDTVYNEDIEINSEDVSNFNFQKYYFNKCSQGIFEMAFFCETNYECQQQMACYQYCWEGDPNIPKCNHCDNCLRQQQDNVILTDLENETLLMASIIHELLKRSKESGAKLEKVKKEYVIDVFFGANNKNVKNNDLVVGKNQILKKEIFVFTF